MAWPTLRGSAAAIAAALASVTQRQSVPAAQRRERLAEACRLAFPHAPIIRPHEFLRKRAQAPWDIVDARSDRERAVSILPGAVTADDAHDSGRPVLVYCTVGWRSGALVTQLRDEGVRAFNLWGGVTAWAAAGQPFVTPEGQSTRKVHVYALPWDVLPPEYESVR
jgi:sodium/bile acid cotransporter 7